MRAAVAELERAAVAGETEMAALRAAGPTSPGDSFAAGAVRARLLLQQTGGADGSPAPLSAAEAGSSSRAQLYAKYHEASESLAAAQAEKDAMGETLQAVLSDVDAKLPRILEQRQQLQTLSEAHSEMGGRLEAAMREGEMVAARAAQLEAALGERDKQVAALDIEVADYQRQLQLVLSEAQRLNAIASGATVATPRGGRQQSSPAFGMVAAPSPGATPPRAGLSAHPSTPADVISANLVDFKDISEMQSQNMRLVQVGRAVYCPFPVE